jgi:hypothetical protein
MYEKGEEQGKRMGCKRAKKLAHMAGPPQMYAQP